MTFSVTKTFLSSVAGAAFDRGLIKNINDRARLGLPGLNNGQWHGKTILSQKWVAMARTPTGPNPGYGFCNWFLNTDRKMYPAARVDSVAFVGDGANIVFVDYQHGMVAVVRSIDSRKMPEFVRLLEAAAQ